MIALQQHIPWNDLIMSSKIAIFICMIFLPGLHLSLKAQKEIPASAIDCTILVEGGRKITVDRFWRITGSNIEYEHGGSLHDLSIDRIHSIRCGDAGFLIKDGALIAVKDQFKPTDLADTISSVEHYERMYELGRIDAKAHYHGAGALIAGVLTSPTLIIPPIIAAIPPGSNRSNPNLDLYHHDVHYRKGYRRKAHEKKAVHVLGGMVLGIIGLSLLL